jgi:hypothetical protein
MNIGSHSRLTSKLSSRSNGDDLQSIPNTKGSFTNTSSARPTCPKGVP